MIYPVQKEKCVPNLDVLVLLWNRMLPNVSDVPFRPAVPNLIFLHPGAGSRQSVVVVAAAVAVVQKNSRHAAQLIFSVQRHQHCTHDPHLGLDPGLGTTPLDISIT